MSKPWPLNLDTPFGPLVIDRTGKAFALEADGQEALSFGLGWLHSRFRGQGCLLASALVQGRLSEYLSPRPEYLEMDRFVRLWHFDQEMEAELSLMDAGCRAQVQAYTQGFNHLLGNRKKAPWEKTMPQAPRWQMEHTILLARTLGFFSWWETEGERQRLFFDLVRGDLPWTSIKELFPEVKGEPDRERWRALPALPTLSPPAQALFDLVPRWRTSRAWAVKGLFTKIGKPLLAGSYETDASTSLAPFLEVVMKTPHDHWRGLNLPGTPALICGRNTDLAWHGAPAFAPIVDFRYAEIKGNEFRGPSGWVPLEMREAEINMGTKALHLETFRETPTGTLWCDRKQEGWNHTAAWMGRRHSGTLCGLLKTMTARTCEEVKTLWQGLGSAALDFLVADRSGGVASLSTGPRLAPEFKMSSVGEELPRPGADTEEKSFHLLDTGSDPQRTGSGPVFNRTDKDFFEKLLNGLGAPLVQDLLQAIRFILPESPLGNALRTWNCQWDGGPESRLIHLTRQALWEALRTGENNPLGRALAPGTPAFDRIQGQLYNLLKAPDSTLLPGAARSKTLAQAVIQAMESYNQQTKAVTAKNPLPPLAPWVVYPGFGQKPGVQALGELPGDHTTPLRSHTENLGGRLRSFWASVAWVSDLAEPQVRLRHWGEVEENLPGERDSEKLLRFHNL